MSKSWFNVITITTIVLSILLASSSFTVKAVDSGAPFSIIIEPDDLTVNVGDEVTYEISIEADEGFNESINFELEVSALTWQTSFEVGFMDPPYPQEFTYSFIIPEEIPIGITATAIVRGTSGVYEVEETVKLTIQKPIPGFPIESVILGTASLVVILWVTKRERPQIFT
jgi:16S rRNA G966 N2-methylase RsmD